MAILSRLLTAGLTLLSLGASAQGSDAAVSSTLDADLKRTADAYLRARQPDLFRQDAGWTIAKGMGKTWDLTYRAAPKESGKAHLSAVLQLSSEGKEVLKENITVLRSDWDILASALAAPDDLKLIAETAARNYGAFDPALPWVMWDSKDWISWNRRYRLYAVKYFDVTADGWLLAQKRPDGSFGGGANVLLAKKNHRVLKVFFEK